MEYHIDKLRKNGFKITPKRLAIIGLLSKENRFLSPERIFSKLKKEFKRVSFPSVYRNLEEMYGIGLIFKIQKPDRRLYYALCRAGDDEHHHHIVCVKCGRVGEFYDCGLLKKKTAGGFRILRHSLQLEGVCPDCDK